MTVRVSSTSGLVYNTTSVGSGKLTVVRQLCQNRKGTLTNPTPGLIKQSNNLGKSFCPNDGPSVLYMRTCP